MPLAPTPDGFIVTYDRVKCAVFGLAAIVFASLMIAIGLDAFFSFLTGTPLDDIELDRQPVWAWAGLLIIGGAVFFAMALWNAKNALYPGAAMTFDHDGVNARSLIGRRLIKWEEIGTVDVVNGTVFLTPAPGSTAKPTPLQTLFTSVSADELTHAMAQHRPELFGAVDEARM